MLARRLALDEREHVLAIGVVVLLGIEVRGQRLDELVGDRELAIVDLDVLDGRDLVDRVGVDDLVGEDHRRHPERVVADRAHRDELLLGADDDGRDRDAARVAHGLEQQPVGLGAARPGREVVRVVVVDRVDVVERDEVLDLDRLRLLGIERLELARLDQHVAIGRELIALDDVLVGHLVARRRIDALLLDAHAGLAVELMKAHGLARHGGVELDGDGHQPEGDGACPDRPWHGYRLARDRAVPCRRTAGCTRAA